MTLTKIVLTGGPCAGKTTGLARIVEYFTKIGYKVFTVGEGATQVINGNAKPWEIASVPFQVNLYSLVKSNENTFEKMAESGGFEKVLIVCDRGCLDGEAYLSEEDKKVWHDTLGLSSTDMMREYDAVFHLVTAAKGASECYTTENNQARIETVEEAVEADDRTMEAWTGHPHFRVIDNTTGFEEKIIRLLSEISSFLGEPEPYEIERKFLIEMPDLEKLNNMKKCRRVEILQTYLSCETEGKERRVRQRGDGNSYILTYTEKKKVSDVKRVEIERQLKPEEYINLLLEADTYLHQIRKTRYCIPYKQCYLEIDIYPFWGDKAILEVELPDETSEVHIPNYIKVIREVTDDKNFKNRKLAESHARV